MKRFFSLPHCHCEYTERYLTEDENGNHTLEDALVISSTREGKIPIAYNEEVCSIILPANGKEKTTKGMPSIENAIKEFLLIDFNTKYKVKDYQKMVAVTIEKYGFFNEQTEDTVLMSDLISTLERMQDLVSLIQAVKRAEKVKPQRKDKSYTHYYKRILSLLIKLQLNPANRSIGERHKKDDSDKTVPLVHELAHFLGWLRVSMENDISYQIALEENADELSDPYKEFLSMLNYAIGNSQNGVFEYTYDYYNSVSFSTDIIEILRDYYTVIAPIYIQGNKLICQEDMDSNLSSTPVMEIDGNKCGDKPEEYYLDKLISISRQTIKMEYEYFTNGIEFKFDEEKLAPILSVPNIIVGFYFYFMSIDTSNKCVCGICKKADCKNIFFQPINKIGTRKVYCSEQCEHEEVRSSVNAKDGHYRFGKQRSR